MNSSNDMTDAGAVLDNGSEQDHDGAAASAPAAAAAPERPRTLFERRQADALEAEGAAGGEEQWLPGPAAMRLLGCSKTTLRRKAKAGVLPTQLRKGRTYYRITGAAIRALAHVKKETAADLCHLEIVRALTGDGESPEAVCRRLSAPPTAVRKAILEIEQMQQSYDEWLRRRRIHEYEHGSPNHPTSWAWVGAKAVGLTYEEAKIAFEEWLTSGGENHLVSPLVRAALSSEAAWTSAIVAWKVEWRAEEQRRKAISDERDLSLSQKHERAAHAKVQTEMAQSRLHDLQARARERTIERAGKQEPPGKTPPLGEMPESPEPRAEVRR